ncbi:MAG: M56 family metallopeptidase [Ruminococcaceae bacterium]|nr:M56 family metallopeptidase [Oscillospiraceae bacterium]
MTSAKLFLSVCNLAASAGWAVIAVMLIRLLLGLPGLRRIPRRYVCLLWAVVGLRLVFPFSPESVLSLIPSAEVLPQTILYDSTPTVTTGVPALNAVINDAVMPSFAPNPGDSVNPMQVLTAIGSWVWIAGAVLMLVYMLVSYLFLYRRMRFATRLAGEDGVYESDAVSSPFVFGLIRPKIYLPYNMDAETRSHVIAHERAHLSRGDHFIKPAAFLLLSVYWFHPLLWAAYILLCRDIESACDERAARDMTAAERKSYAAALVRCSVRARQITACPLAFGETGVKRRVTAILDYRRPTLWVLIAAVVLCVVFAVCFGTNPQVHSFEMMPWTEYRFAAFAYQNGMYSYVLTAETAPSFAVDEDDTLWIQYSGGTAWTSVGKLAEYSVTEKSLSALFDGYVDADGSEFASLKNTVRACRAARRAEYVHPATGDVDIYTLIQRDNGDILVLYSHRFPDADGTLNEEIPRWAYRIMAPGTRAELPTYDSYRVAYAYAGSPAPDYNEIHRMPYADHTIEAFTQLSEYVDPERLRHASVIPVLRFASADDLRQFREAYRDAFVFDDSLGDRIPAFDYAVRTFGDSEALFRDNVLFVACINAPSGSHVFSVSQITAENGVLAVDIDRYAPELCTDDEISHFVLIAVPRTVAEKTEAVVVLLENAPSPTVIPDEAFDFPENYADTLNPPRETDNTQQAPAYEDTPSGTFTVDPDVTASDGFALHPEYETSELVIPPNGEENETRPDIEDEFSDEDFIVIEPTE